METFVKTENKPLLLEVTLSSPHETKGQLMVYDPYYKNTKYINRDLYFNGTKTFYVRMPISPKSAKVFSTCKIEKVVKKDLPRKFNLVDIQNYNIKSFMRFSYEFCTKCGWLKDDYEYVSDDNIYTIQYLKQIRNDNGSVSPTPCRIHKETGVMQVNSEKFRKMTVPMRLALLLHEYMHFYKNINPEYGNVNE